MMRPPQISIRSCLLLLIAFAISLALIRGPARSTIGIIQVELLIGLTLSVFAIWILVGVSIGYENGRPKLGTLTAFVFVLISLTLGFIVATSSQTFSDPVTGSIKRNTRIFGFLVQSTIQRSTLEKWCTEHRIRHKTTWVFIRGHSFRGRGSGRAPPIYHFRFYMDKFIEISTDAVILDFYHKLLRGSAPQQEKLIETTCNELLQKLVNEK